ncbi:MAG: PaaI family thioesterase [Chloroflexi bacterium]|nr:PaaI family thioesterase [Chloroflexota bacterium]MBI2758212.1 PaaI family thioesterase [Chloroflexota bacterium]
MKRKLPEHGWCFVCGSENPHSIGITMWVNDDGVMTSEFTLTNAQQGPPGYSHGGASAAILDEAMGLVVWAAGMKVAAVNLEINYHKPLPLQQHLTLEARITEKDERKVFSAGEIRLPDGTIAVSGRGIYVVAPQLFEKVGLIRGE